MPETYSNILSQAGEQQRPSIVDRASRLGIDVADKTPDQLMAQIVDYRRKQYSQSRASEYVTGIGIGGSKLIDRFAQDQEIVRQKYGLPDWDIYLQDPHEYERRINALAKQEGVEIVKIWECGDYFDQYPNAFAVQFSSYGRNRIGADVASNDSLAKYGKGLRDLTHEFIHAMQQKRYPQMPPEMMEYEAYLSHTNVDYLRHASPEIAQWIIFGYTFQGSVRHMYDNLGESPPWDDPNWFLEHIDGIKIVTDQDQPHK